MHFTDFADVMVWNTTAWKILFLEKKTIFVPFWVATPSNVSALNCTKIMSAPKAKVHWGQGRGIDSQGGAYGTQDHGQIWGRRFP